MYNMEMWLGMLKKFIEVEPILSTFVVGMALLSGAYVTRAVLVAVADIVTCPFKTVAAIVSIVFGTIKVVLRGHDDLRCAAECCSIDKCCSVDTATVVKETGVAKAECCASLDLVGSMPRIRHPLEHDMTAHRRSGDKV